MKLEILYEDDVLLILNKPAGLLVAPDRWNRQRPNLMTLLAAARPGQYLANVHRLDFQTTGVLCIAKTRPALIHLARQFLQRTTRKTYLALAHGLPATARIELPVGPHPRRAGLSRIDPRAGKPAVTLLDILETYRHHSLLRLHPLTGRQHQIRVHLQAIGTPLVGDAEYSGAPLRLSALKPHYKTKPDEPERPLLARPALHAEQLTLTHPTTGAPVTFRAEWPHDLAVAIKYLRRFALRAPVARAPAASAAGQKACRPPDVLLSDNP